MRELFYIWIVVASPPGSVNMYRQDHPYKDPNQCVDVAVKMLPNLQKRNPMIKGALCFTPSEYNGKEV